MTSRAANRARMPTVSLFVDEFRKHFPDARVTYASEAGHVMGKRGDEGMVLVAHKGKRK